MLLVALEGKEVRLCGTSDGREEHGGAWGNRRRVEGGEGQMISATNEEGEEEEGG